MLVLIYFIIGAMFFVNEWKEYDEFLENMSVKIDEDVKRKVRTNHLTYHFIMCLLWPLHIAILLFVLLKFKFYGKLE